MNKLNAYLRLLEIKTKVQDRETFTNSIYSALSQRTDLERSLIIGELRKRHHKEMEEKEKIKRQEYLNTEEALHVSKFQIVN